MQEYNNSLIFDFSLCLVNNIAINRTEDRTLYNTLFVFALEHKGHTYQTIKKDGVPHISMQVLSFYVYCTQIICLIQVIFHPWLLFSYA